jgi:predicted transcriptional regulator
MVTQAGLSDRLGIAVGSVNWYIKRLVQRGWVKVSHLDRTRLNYDLTSERKGSPLLIYSRSSEVKCKNSQCQDLSIIIAGRTMTVIRHMSLA